MSDAFTRVLEARLLELADACTQCGKCFTACPMAAPVGLAGADPVRVLSGLVDLLRGGEGSEEARRWTGACSSSGLCREACDYGVDPRLLVRMANYAHVSRRDRDVARRNAVNAFRGVARAVRIVSRLQLDAATLARLQPTPGRAPPAAPPDAVLYTGCNVHKTPHILVLVLGVLEALDVGCEIVGGPTGCCGISQFRAGDAETSGRAGLAALAQIESKRAPINISWCPSCQSQFEEVLIPGHAQLSGRAFALVPFFEFLESRLDRLAPLMTRPVHKRVAINERPGYPRVVQAVRRILAAIPGVEVVDLDVPRAGLMSNFLTVTPRFKEDLRRRELEAAAVAGVTTLATVFHACHRELCHYEKDVTFEIVNVMEIIGASMGLAADDIYKRLKMARDADEMLAMCSERIAEHGLDPGEAVEVLLADQRAARPLQGAVLER